MTRDRLEDAFLRLRAAAHADEYVPMEDVIETVLARLARAEKENRWEAYAAFGSNYKDVTAEVIALREERDEALRLLATRVEAKRLDEAQEEIARLCAEAKRADEEATTLANSDLATTEQVVRALRAENERLRECNDAMREPMRRLREAANMPAQGESAVVGEVLARLADRSRRLDQIAAAAALVQTTVQRYFDQHGPSCDEHADEPDHTCPTCCIDIDASDAISGLKFWSKP